jgi:hypothetical protein
MTKGKLSEWEKVRREWQRVTRQYGGTHPHRAAEVIIQAAGNEKDAGRAPYYLINLRDVLLKLYPVRRKEPEENSD